MRNRTPWRGDKAWRRDTLHVQKMMLYFYTSLQYVGKFHLILLLLLLFTDQTFRMKYKHCVLLKLNMNVLGVLLGYNVLF